MILGETGGVILPSAPNENQNGPVNLFKPSRLFSGKFVSTNETWEWEAVDL